MCGIVGLYNLTGNFLIEEELSYLKKRGPDVQKSYKDEENKVILGSTRLSIRDESSVADQPFFSSSKRWIITLNGEISNYLNLKARISGYEFKTTSDTEVIAAGLENEGIEFLKKLEGMYAISIWDDVNKELFLCRDYPGIKPLYWAKLDNGKIFYSSEFTSMINISRKLNVSTEMELDKVFEYLIYRNTLLYPNTLVKKIKKVNPGEIVKISDEGVSNIQIYYPNNENSNSLEKVGKEELNNRFVEAISKNLEFDQKIGVFLSGGVDSSTVLSECVRQGAKVEAFTLAYETEGEHSFSELPFSHYVCKNLGVKLHEVKIDENDFIDSLHDAIIKQDGLSMDPTIIAWHHLGKTVKNNNISVSVSGTGSDEVFGSYEWLHAKNFEEFDQWVRSYSMRKWLKEDKELSLASKMAYQKREKKYTDLLNMGYTNNEAIRLYGMYHLEADALPRVDLGTMNYSVECRVPFLEKSFFERALDTEPSKGKEAIREIATKNLPKVISERPKCGFPHPVFIWMKHGKLKKIVKNYLLDNNHFFSEFLDKNRINQFFNSKESLMKKKISAETYDESASLWYLFYLLG